MSDDAKTTHAIDYLEPWSENGDRIYARLESRPDDGYPDGGVLMEWKHFGGICQYGTRAVACVNALAGVADPSAAIRELTHAAERALAYIAADGRDVIEEELLRNALNRIKGVKS